MASFRRLRVKRHDLARQPGKRIPEIGFPFSVPLADRCQSRFDVGDPARVLVLVAVLPARAGAAEPC